MKTPISIVCTQCRNCTDEGDPTSEEYVPIELKIYEKDQSINEIDGICFFCFNTVGRTALFAAKAAMGDDKCSQIMKKLKEEVEEEPRSFERTGGSVADDTPSQNYKPKEGKFNYSGFAPRDGTTCFRKRYNEAECRCVCLGARRILCQSNNQYVI